MNMFDGVTMKKPNFVLLVPIGIPLLSPEPNNSLDCYFLGSFHSTQGLFKNFMTFSMRDNSARCKVLVFRRVLLLGFSAAHELTNFVTYFHQTIYFCIFFLNGLVTSSGSVCFHFSHQYVITNSSWTLMVFFFGTNWRSFYVGFYLTSHLSLRCNKICNSRDDIRLEKIRIHFPTPKWRLRQLQVVNKTLYILYLMPNFKGCRLTN